jgi:hypothetical protein
MTTYATIGGKIFTSNPNIAKVVDPEDLTLAKGQFGWLINNPQRYTHVRKIQAALRDRQAQLPMDVIWAQPQS